MNILFEGFELSFDPDVSFLDSTIYIDQFDYASDSGQIVFDNLPLAWKGVDTFRRVTREEKRNEFQLK